MIVTQELTYINLEQQKTNINRLNKILFYKNSKFLKNILISTRDKIR